MIYYASRTGTKVNLAAMREVGFRLLISRTGVWRTEGFPYGLDNGRWTDSEEDPPRPFDDAARADFIQLVEMLGAGADFLVVPDTVGRREESLALTREWLPRLRGKCRLLLIAVQDGMTFDDVADLVGDGVGIFMGGSTEWKLANMRTWGKWSHDRGVYFHVGRVNTARRVALAVFAEADSADGSSATRFRKTVPLLANAVRQPDLFARRKP